MDETFWICKRNEDRDFHLAVRGGLRWETWSKDGEGQGFFFHEIIPYDKQKGWNHHQAWFQHSFSPLPPPSKNCSSFSAHPLLIQLFRNWPGRSPMLKQNSYFVLTNYTFWWKYLTNTRTRFTFFTLSTPH